MRDRSVESQVYRASGLNLLIAAIILWNTRYLDEAFVELDRQGVNVAPTIVTHVAPLGWEHIGLTGDYVWTDAEQPSDGVLRPLRRRESMLAVIQFCSHEPDNLTPSCLHPYKPFSLRSLAQYGIRNQEPAETNSRDRVFGSNRAEK